MIINKIYQKIKMSWNNQNNKKRICKKICRGYKSKLNLKNNNQKEQKISWNKKKKIKKMLMTLQSR